MARAISSSPRSMMDFQFERWDLVIKVKYGDSLRRIGTTVNGQLMEHDMAKLRAKIVSLFKFNPDADFLLTYTDEDGDLVTLDNDDELRDAVIGQRLNPLRVNIQLKSNTTASSDAARSESVFPAAAAKSSNSTTPPPSINLAVDEALKSVPEPFRSALSDLSGDVLKVATAAPVFSQFVECFSKLGLAHVSQNSHGTPCESSGGSSGASTRLVDLNASEEPKGTDVPIQEASTTVSIGPSPKQQESVDVVQNVGISDSGTLDLNQDVPKSKNIASYPFDDLLTSIWTTNERLESEKEGANAHRDGKDVMTSGSPSWLPLPNHLAPMHPNLIYGGYPDIVTGDTTTKLPTSSQVHPTTQGVNYHSGGTMSMHGGPQQTDVFTPIYFHPSVVPPYRSHRHHEKTPRTSHRGVQCDGCGMHPIVGSRFKSKLKDDYDLCNLCFTVMGNEADYMRIDRPVHRTPRLPREFPGLHSKYRFPSPNAFHGCGGRTPRVKLESRFIQDVTVLDGTLMGPSTHFTKIWRMRNNGTAAWPFGTQLVWVGGDQFGDHSSTDLEIPENGFPVEGELDIAVDFTAPSRPGRYVSYWRMASPSGQKFGQRVWVLIQVDYSRPNTPGTGTHPELNLNLPPGSNGRTGVAIIDVNVEPLDSGFTESDITYATEEVVKSVKDIPSGHVEHPSQVMVGDLLNASNDELSQPQPQPTPADVVPPTTLYPLIDIPSAEVPAADGNQVEQTLLKELVDMGFKQIDLNKEILRLNEYDLEQSVDDLCGYAEWDPLLIELQEMGFADKDLNKKLLIKNGGSIKRAVLDLIAGERSQ